MKAKAPIHCNKIMELKAISFGYSAMGFQCKKCGAVRLVNYPD